MKKLRIRKIITALIIITWVPSSFASPSSVASSSSYIYYHASSSSIEDSISIVDIDGKSQINFNFITGSNGQELVIFEHCQDGSCKPLGLKEGYSLEKLSSDEQFRELLETWKISSGGSDEQFRELLEAWKISSGGSDEQFRELLAALQENDLQTSFEKIDRKAGFVQAGIGAFMMVGIRGFMSLMLGVLGFAGTIFVAAVMIAVLVDAFNWFVLKNRPDADMEEAKEGTSSSTLVTKIEEALEKFGSKMLVPLPRD